MDSTFIAARISYFQTLIESFESAISSLTVGNKRSFSVNTGQTQLSVTRNDLTTLKSQLDWAYAQLEFWEMRLNGGVAVNVC